MTTAQRNRSERSKDDCKACNRWKVQFSICVGRNLCRDQRSDIQPRSHHEGAECSIQQIQRWLKIYFPEYLTVYKKFDTTTGRMILEEVPLPTMVTALGVDNIIKIWREHKVRGKGASFNRAKTLVDAAHERT